MQKIAFTAGILSFVGMVPGPAYGQFAEGTELPFAQLEDSPLAEAERRIDALLIDYDALDAWRKRARRSVVGLSVRMPSLDPNIERDLQPFIEATAVAVQGPKGPMLLTAAPLVVGANSVRIRLPGGGLLDARRVDPTTGVHARVAPASAAGVDADADPASQQLLAAFAPTSWPKELVPLTLAGPDAPPAGLAALALTNVGQIGPDESFAPEVVSKVYFLGRPDAVNAEQSSPHLYVTDVVNAAGQPLLTRDFKLAAIACAASAGTAPRSIAVHAAGIEAWFDGEAVELLGSIFGPPPAPPARAAQPR